MRVFCVIEDGRVKDPLLGACGASLSLIYNYIAHMFRSSQVFFNLGNIFYSWTGEKASSCEVKWKESKNENELIARLKNMKLNFSQ